MPPYYNGQGRGVIDVHGLALGLAATVRSYAAGVFASGVPAGFLKSSQPNLSQEAATALKTAWLAQHGGAAPFDRGPKRDNRFYARSDIRPSTRSSPTRANGVCATRRSRSTYRPTCSAYRATARHTRTSSTEC
jgi:hypothetical protein